jgi:16S rRNA (cytidine1402-2'-O)-methyltransferase
VRRTGKTTSAKRASGDDGGSGRDPNRRGCTSKPEAEPAPPFPFAPGLYLVATPIGNLADVTLRALDVLRGADLVCAEDTRITRRLLARYAIERRLERYDDHTAERARPAILAALRRGERVALVADAGTPLVSDPGYKLVRAALDEGLPVTTVPGPSAALAALLLSGLPPDAFLFGGFLPARRAARRKSLEKWAGVPATLIFFEGPSRLADSLADMADILGDRPVAIARELTKLHEEVRRGGLAALAEHYREAGPPRGETVIVVAPPEAQAPDMAAVEARLAHSVGALGLKEAAAQIAAETGLKRRDLYRRGLALRHEGKR